MYREQLEKLMESHALHIKSIEERHALHIKSIEERHAASWALTTANSRSDIANLAKQIERLAEAAERTACKYGTGQTQA